VLQVPKLQSCRKWLGSHQELAELRSAGQLEFVQCLLERELLVLVAMAVLIWTGVLCHHSL
jgi:hypothetical protein